MREALAVGEPVGDSEAGPEGGADSEPVGEPVPEGEGVAPLLWVDVGEPVPVEVPVSLLVPVLVTEDVGVAVSVAVAVAVALAVPVGVGEELGGRLNRNTLPLNVVCDSVPGAPTATVSPYAATARARPQSALMTGGLDTLSSRVHRADALARANMYAFTRPGALTASWSLPPKKVTTVPKLSPSMLSHALSSAEHTHGPLGPPEASNTQTVPLLTAPPAGAPTATEAPSGDVATDVP